MKSESSQNPRRSLFPGLGLLLTLASCGASHVGETWQCPLAQGSSCTSVERADPAIRPVPEPTELAPLVLETITTTGSGEIDPSHKHEGRHSPNSRTGNAQAISESCRSRCNPVGWFWRWLTGGDSRASAGAAELAVEAAPPGEASTEALRVSTLLGDNAGRSTAADTTLAAQPQPDSRRNSESTREESTRDTQGPSESMRDTQVPVAADVRVPEKIGRVWIAPWVDATGVYREGAWVWIVLSPATWRESL